MRTQLKHKDATVYVDQLSSGKNQIRVELSNDSLAMPTGSCETSYPVSMIDDILAVKGPAYLCDEILREESPNYVQRHLRYDVLGYVEASKFENARVLDFGCGSGASTIVLARMFPNSEIVGIELDDKLLGLAKRRVSHHGIENIEFIASPDPESLPPGIGQFAFVLFIAVYEHLLPGERAILVPKIWKVLEPGGILFLNQTPNKHFPIETHTTSGLPLINYLSDGMACYYARHFSRRKLMNFTWEQLLRKGIRGGSVGEILGILRGCGGEATLLDPIEPGIEDRVDLWYAKSAGVRFKTGEQIFRWTVKIVMALTGVTVMPSLSLAIKKPARQKGG